MKSFCHKLWKNHLKKIQFFYFLKVRILNKNYKNYLRDMNSGRYKDKATIKREMALVRDYWHCQPLHYVRYRLFEKILTDEQLIDYVPPYVYYNFHLPPLLENVNPLYKSKSFQLKSFHSKGILTPDTIGIYRQGKLLSLDGTLLDERFLFEVLNQGEKLFCKPDTGCGGHGIVVFERDGDCLINRRTKQLLRNLFEGLEPSITYVIQRQASQIDFLDQLNNGCINTFRVVTKIDERGLTMACCFLRSGRRHSDIDNNTQGGMSLDVDVDTGRIADVAILEHGNDTFTEHPDNGFVFKDKYIPDWTEYKKRMLEIAAMYPELPEVGWDFALTPEGVMVIELNIGFGLDLMQLCCAPMRHALNVRPYH